MISWYDWQLHSQVLLLRLRLKFVLVEGVCVLNEVVLQKRSSVMCFMSNENNLAKSFKLLPKINELKVKRLFLKTWSCLFFGLVLLCFQKITQNKVIYT